MASVSVPPMYGWGNLHSPGQAPMGYLRHMGEIWQRAWASPFSLWLVLGDFPPHRRFLVRPRLLTRLSSLPYKQNLQSSRQNSRPSNPD